MAPRPIVLLDTHPVIWLFQGPVARMPSRVRQRIVREELAISPLVELELGFLHEIGRLGPTPAQMIDELRRRVGLVVLDVSAAALCREAGPISWTRDPFDRLLAALATLTNLPLVTKDETIRRNLSLAWWAD